MLYKSKRRRGVVILVVLSLLVLFTLLVITYAIVAGHYRRAAEAFGREELVGVAPQKDLDKAFYQLIRDTPFEGSALRFHSLLRDVYGENGFYGTILSAQFVDDTNEQLIDIVVDASNLRGIADGGNYTLSEYPRDYGGCVFTILSGRNSNTSTRILNYSPTDEGFQVFRFDRDDNHSIEVSDMAGRGFVVNGRPFSGTGRGWNGTSIDDSALQPNYAYHVPTNQGGSNECYDAADYQNMFLALISPDATSSADIIPSFHRPELVSYWQGHSSWGDADFRRRVVLRPEEPNFDGSNPSFSLINGPWDVDNDGDGIPDSIWIDLGFPIQTATDGRRYKPLFAILCQDLDGRFNVNFHDRYAGLLRDDQPTDESLSGGMTTAQMPRGQGYGPSEISLRSVYARSPDDFPNNTVFSPLRRLLQARYGSDLFPGHAGLDPISELRFGDFPTNYYDPTSGTFGGTGVATAFRSPPDLQGELRMGLNASGQPFYEQYFLGTGDGDFPFEFGVAQSRVGRLSVDTPFSPAELERILRSNDLDAAKLPSRLSQIPTALPTSLVRRLITTDSYDMPVPRENVLRMLSERLVLPDPPAYVTSPDEFRAWEETYRRRQVMHLLSLDLLQGTKMDINRPLESMEDRQRYARHLYVLALLLSTEDTPDATVARQLAQWAVNVVDFRDADAIMTRFEYDLNPFVHDAPTPPPTTTPDTRLSWGPTDEEVWGCERPELLITQTLAFHARRTEDRDDDSSGELVAGGDPHFDQRLRPHGALFVELYNPWTGTDMQTTPPQELYTGGGLHLSRTAGGSPVWRLIITRNIDRNPDDPLGQSAERAVYFAPSSGNLPAGSSHGERRFFTSNTAEIVVSPGEFAVLGPSGLFEDGTTTIGRRRLPPAVNPAVDARQAVELGVPADLRRIDTHRIFLDRDNNQVEVYDGAPTSNSAVVVWVDRSDLPDPTDHLPMHLSVSEPIDGYPRTAGGMTWRPPNVAEHCEGEYEETPDSRTGSIDEPLDTDPEIVSTDGTILNWSVVHLQRLADPTRQWHETDNPYRTIDSSLVDLTVFNGVTDDTDPNITQELDVFWCLERGEQEVSYNPNNPPLDPSSGPDDPRPNATLPTDRHRFIEGNPLTKRTLWQQALTWNPQQRENRPPEVLALLHAHQLADPVSHYFPYRVTRSLGGQNHWYRSPNWEPVLGTLVSNIPFPWLTWNDRPFVSHYELMQVPATSSFQLLRNYEADPNLAYQADEFNPPLPQEPPDDAADSSYPSTPPPFWPYPLPIPYPSEPPNEWPYGEQSASRPRKAQFNHLLNFFDSDDGANSLHLYRLFDFVHVPSRFNRTEIMLDPVYFSRPFDRIPTYREPGRVNVNTMTSPLVWNGVRNGFSGPSFQDLLLSRRGYFGQAINPDVPTRFANPFRSASSAAFVHDSVVNAYPDWFHDIDGGFLRRYQWTHVYTPYNHDTGTPLIEEELADGTMIPYRFYQTRRRPLFQGGNTRFADDAQRNSYFRYQNLHRLGNLTTTRSNVYAIWITVGYFEVELNTNASGNVEFDEFHPEGYRVAQELGIDTGEVRRHRAFYIVDRTIPVAFQPGENHNVDRAVLLRRFIE